MNAKPDKSTFVKAFDSIWDGLSEDDRDTLIRIGQEIPKDLSPLAGRFFSEEDQRKIFEKAAEILKSKMPSTDLRREWEAVVTSFHRESMWGFTPVMAKPKKTVKNPHHWELASYFWVAFQSLVVMKMVILYFGLKKVEEPSPWMTFGLYAAITFSFCSLVWFMIKKNRRGKNSNGE